ETLRLADHACLPSLSAVRGHGTREGREARAPRRRTAGALDDAASPSSKTIPSRSIERRLWSTVRVDAFVIRMSIAGPVPAGGTRVRVLPCGVGRTIPPAATAHRSGARPPGTTGPGPAEPPTVHWTKQPGPVPGARRESPLSTNVRVILAIGALVVAILVAYLVGSAGWLWVTLAGVFFLALHARLDTYPFLVVGAL